MAGELIYLVGGEHPDALSMVTRAISGRIARCVLTWTGSPLAALEAACRSTGAAIRPAALAKALQQPCREGFIVTIRQEDRERFEETTGGVYSRWIGETTAQAGFRLAEPD